MARRILGVVGTRPPHPQSPAKNFAEYSAIIDDLWNWFDKLNPHEVEFVSGGAKGVDQTIADIARKFGIPIREFLPNYRYLGSRAPTLRNQLIVDHCQELYAWPSSWSTGTLDTIRLAQAANKLKYVYNQATPP